MTSSIFTSLQDTALAALVRDEWFPVVESIHVVALATVVGTIMVVDLRLIGLASMSLRFSHISKRLLPWTWAAFLMAAVTGAMMFVSNAEHYAQATSFQVKIVLLFLAGVNMLGFHLGAGRRVSEWDTGVPGATARLSGALSLFIWAGVVAAGRWIGFS